MKLLKHILIFVLTLESKLILKKYRPFIVAVTGSVGKTSTKDAIYCVLKNESRYVRKSEKSLNSDIGLPLTVIGVPNAWRSLTGWWDNIRAGARLVMSTQDYPDCLILEIGADHPGDIKSVVKWLKPDIAVITKVSSTPVHVEFFGSPQEVFEEKESLALGVKAGGTVVLFADDEKVMTIAEKVSALGARVVTFGMKEGSSVKGSAYSVVYADRNGKKIPTGFSFNVESNNQKKMLKILNSLGETYQYPLLAAAAVGKAKGMTLEVIIRALSAYDAPRGRLRIIEGKNDSTIIDDTYNSSPDAAEAALRTLTDVQTYGGRRIAVLGDMMELGKYSADEHRKIGKLAASSVTRLITVGQRSRGTAHEAVAHGLSANMIESFDSSSDAATHVPDSVRAGDVILVKGSQSVRMERVVEALMKEPSRAPELLVRQEREWLEKV